MTSTWKCPVGVTTVQVECWGAGGGSGGSSASVGGGGGGGGGYSRTNALSVTPGTVYTVTVGTGGTGGGVGANGSAGGDSWFNTSGTVIAKGGGLGPANAGTGGAGGAGGSGIGDVTFTGGAGGDTATATGGAGGGSAAGFSAGGNAGQIAQAGGGAGGAHVGMGGGGGSGGVGGTSSAGDGGVGNPYGGGGGGGGSGASNNAIGAAGASGAVLLTWTTSITGLPSAGTALTNPFTAVQYGNVSTDDGDYFIERGSENVIREYKHTHINNTDKITFTWKGRSTQSTLISPILVQIYNANSMSWETLANINSIPSDTDAQVTVTQSANLSNYYDSGNVVTFRSYQLVV